MIIIKNVVLCPRKPSFPVGHLPSTSILDKKKLNRYSGPHGIVDPSFLGTRFGHTDVITLLKLLFFNSERPV